MKKIYCLFSVTNEYNQPQNNLVGWWADKPTQEQVSEATGYVVTSKVVVSLACNGYYRESGDTEYRLEVKNEGRVDHA